MTSYTHSKLMNQESYKHALAAQTDYSTNFTQMVEELCVKLSQFLEMKFYHDAHMDYSSSQTIELWLDKAYKPVIERHDADFLVAIFVSSKGRFFAARCRVRDAILPKVWNSVSSVELDQNIQHYLQEIASVLKDNGYILIRDSILSELAQGHRTRMDKLPATVFQVLFTEIT